VSPAETEILFTIAVVIVPLGLVPRMLLAERAANRRALALPAPELKVRSPSDVSEGAALYKVHVVCESGRVNLGTSFETAENLTGSPELSAQGVTLETEAGVRLALREGTLLKVHALGGARRELVESVTTNDGGIKQRFSFEVDGATWFLLEGSVPPGAAGHPFRTGAIDFAPAAERYHINPPPPQRKEFSSMGCLTYPLAVSGIVAVLSAEFILWKIAAWVLWTVGVLSVFGGASIANTEFRENHR
jgi:hypothetical protein